MIDLPSSVLLRTSGLRHRFRQHAPLSFRDWEISAGEHWLIHGASGSGKTTLLHIIGGLLRPSEGRVEMANHSLYDLSGSELDHFRGARIGIVFQQPHLIRNLTVSANLLAAEYFAGRKQNKERAARLLNSLGLTGKARSYPDRLSQGQQQRAAIARAVINSPKLIIADEPTSSLDDESARQVVKLLKRVAAESEAAMIIATHDGRLQPHFSKTFTLTNAQ